MIPRIIAFVDHEIGFRLLQKLSALSERRVVELVAAVTTVENGTTWWPGVEGLCRQLNIPLFRYREPFSDTLRIDNVDWYLLLSWKHVIPDVLVKQPACGVVNLHYSSLPQYRGVYPVNWAIMDGNKATGVTYHLVTEKIDGGPILLQGETAILASDTARSLQLRLDDLADALFDELVGRILHSDPERLEKRDVRGGGCYKSRRDFNDACELNLDDHRRVGDLLNLLRGMSFLPISRTAYFVDPDSGEKIYISLSLEREKG